MSCSRIAISKFCKCAKIKVMNEMHISFDKTEMQKKRFQSMAKAVVEIEKEGWCICFFVLPER